MKLATVLILLSIVVFMIAAIKSSLPFVFASVALAFVAAIRTKIS